MTPEWLDKRGRFAQRAEPTRHFTPRAEKSTQGEYPVGSDFDFPYGCDAMAGHRRYALLGLCTLSSLFVAGSAQAATFISEYVEGSSNNKAIEIANTGPGSIDLSACELLRYSNGGTNGVSIPLSGTLSAGDVHVVCNPSFDSGSISLCDETSGNITFNGDDAVELRCNGTTLDVIGQIGTDPGSEWGSGDASTANNTICRKSSVTSGDSNGADAFDPAVEWVGLPINTFSGLGTLSGCSAAPVETVSCSASVETIGSIQGTGAQSAVAGQTKTVRGVVTLVAPKLGGFFLQNTASQDDNNPNSSDALWIYNPGEFPVTQGQIHTVKGEVKEYFGKTEIEASAVSSPCGSGSVSTITLDVSAVSTWERYENMMVRPGSDVTVTNNYNLERYNEIGVSEGGVLRQPTEDATPGAQAAAVTAENADRYFLIDDLSSEQNLFPVMCPGGGLDPAAGRTCRAGSVVLANSVRGPLDYGFGQYRIRDTDESISLESGTGARPVAPPNVGSPDIRVGVFNVFNYFVTIDENGNKCGPSNIDCRGADSAEEFEKQAQKIVTAIERMNADVLGLQELENPKNGVLFSEWAVSDLVRRLNAVPGRTACAGGKYQAANPGGPLGSDAIQNGLIYCNLAVQLDAVDVLDDSDLSDLGLGTLGPVFNGENTNRVVIGGKFTDRANGRTFTVAVTHQKSKGSSRSFREACAEGTSSSPQNCDQGDGAGYWNARRNDASTAIRAWLDQNPVLSSDLRLVVGDVNAYGKEDPVTNFTTNGYKDLKTQAGGQDSYVFDGRWGSLDRALANDALAALVTGVDAWTINAEEPRAFSYNEEFLGKGSSREEDAIATYYQPDEFRASDHSPMLLGLCLRENCSAAPTERPALPAPALGGFGVMALGLGLCGLAGLRRKED